jgi:uncharacterized lipoprotein YmbA
MGQFGLRICLLGLLGCASPVNQEEVQLHKVSSEVVSPVTVSVGEGRTVALRVTLSDTLDRPEMVVRNVGSEIQYSPWNRWAEPLKDDLGRLLRTRWAAAPGISRVLSSERARDWSPTLLVMVHVDRFDGERLIGGLNRAVVDAIWRIVQLGDRVGPALSSGLFVREVEPWNGEGFEDLKRLLQELAGDMADAVAESLGESIAALDPEAR